MPIVELPLDVRAPKLTDQSLPITGTERRSAAKVITEGAVASIASDSAEVWPSERSTVNESKSTPPGAVLFEVSEPPTEALGTNCSLPLPASTFVEPKLPFANIVPKAADSAPAPKVGSRSE